MRLRLIRIAFCMLTFATVIFGQQGQPAGGASATNTITLSVSTPNNPVRLGSPVKLTIVMMNKSDHELNFMKDAFLGYYRFEVTKQGGDRARQTRRGVVVDALSGHGDRSTLTDEDKKGNAVFVNVQAGANWTQELDVKDFYTFDEPGRYIITAIGLDPLTHSSVASNAVAITLVP